MHTEQQRSTNDKYLGMQSQPNGLRGQATERLFLAVVNQAISDVLENGTEAREAERWLLSKDFDALNRLFAFPAKGLQSPSQSNPTGKINRVREALRTPGEPHFRPAARIRSEQRRGIASPSEGNVHEQITHQHFVLIG